MPKVSSGGVKRSVHYLLKRPLQPLSGENVVTVTMAMNVISRVLTMNVVNSIFRIPVKDYISLLTFTIVKNSNVRSPI